MGSSRKPKSGGQFARAGFPEEHSKASDFAQLRTTGPYSYVRLPFYSSLIALDYFASLTFLSLCGVVVSTLLLPSWWYLARSEELDLLREWGQAYAEYRRVTPMLFPGKRRKKGMLALQVEAHRTPTKLLISFWSIDKAKVLEGTVKSCGRNMGNAHNFGIH